MISEIRGGFPPTSGQIPQNSGSSDWPNWDPHMAYMKYPAMPTVTEMVCGPGRNVTLSTSFFLFQTWSPGADPEFQKGWFLVTVKIKFGAFTRVLTEVLKGLKMS